MLRYAITDSSLSGLDEPARRAALLSQAVHLARAGIEYLQLREKHLPAAALAALARDLLATLHSSSPLPATQTRLLISARDDIAAATGAAGVHLTAHPDELIPDQVRRVFAAAARPAPVISISCHTLAEVEQARDAHVDLILFGPVFEKRVAGELVSAGVGLDTLRAACAAAGGVKVLALGGITAENATAGVTAGAAGVAGIRLFA